MDAAILPVKGLGRAKGRLASHFDEPQRMAVARALLEDSMHLATNTNFVAWWVVSDDDDVLDGAAARGLAVVRDRGEGLNDALAEAISVVVSEGASSVTVIPSDVPLGRPSDIQDVLDTGATSDVVVTPSRDGRGTNALHLRPPGIIPPRFGARSLQAHVGEAARLELRCSILELPGLSLDIDTIEDVDELLSRDHRGMSRTASVLAGFRAPTR